MVCMNDIMVEKNLRWEMEVNFQSGVNYIDILSFQSYLEQNLDF